jgi:hypothetical protein
MSIHSLRNRSPSNEWTDPNVFQQNPELRVANSRQADTASKNLDGDLRTFLEQVKKGAPKSIAAEFVRSLAGRPSQDLLPGVTLLSSGNAKRDQATYQQLKNFLSADPGLTQQLREAGRSAPIYVIVGDDQCLTPLSSKTLGVNFGASKSQGGLIGQVVVFPAASMKDVATLENELREAADTGALGVVLPSNTSQEAASLTISRLYEEQRSGRPKPASGSDVYTQMLITFGAADFAYQDHQQNSGRAARLKPPAEFSQQVLGLLNKRLSDLGLRDFPDGRVGFKLNEAGRIFPEFVPKSR